MMAPLLDTCRLAFRACLLLFLAAAAWGYADLRSNGQEPAPGTTAQTGTPATTRSSAKGGSPSGVPTKEGLNTQITNLKSGTVAKTGEEKKGSSAAEAIAAALASGDPKALAAIFDAQE